ncbi:MAG: sigma 54-interacting transcriptional regulator, partial [Oscillospiraceae bacterium]
IIEFNGEAEKAYGKGALSVKGKRVDEVLESCNLQELLTRDNDPDSDIRTIGERMYLRKQTQITQDKQVTGAIEILAELSDIRHAEYCYSMEQEKKNRVKGFRAKTSFPDIIGSSKIMRRTEEEAKLFAKTEASILICGETGTGKELFAQSVHNYSGRKKGPFIAINCAALPESLLESELFGYEEGAFTGSKKGGKMGIFELANEGTIFLDEIGEIGLPLQARLLRVLQEKEVMRIGGERIFKVDARVITATNKDIYHMSDKEFRRDLLYRLRVLELFLPPLRQREGDVVEIFLHFLRQRLSLAEHDLELPEDVLGLLRTYSWPGNVRELQNACERFCIYCEQSARLSSANLKKYMLRAIGEDRFLEDVLCQYGYDKDKRGENTERLQKLVRYLKHALDYSNEQVAEVLGVSRTTLWRLEK